MVKAILRGLTAALSAATWVASAQTAPPIGRPDPLDARAIVPPTVYRSSLPLARAADADRAITWRSANDNVARIGGWRSYAREAQTNQPLSAAPLPAVPASAAAVNVKPADKPLPATAGQSGHKAP